MTQNLWECGCYHSTRWIIILVLSIYREVTSDKLYTATPIQRFINESKNKGVNWAIFSDKYGIWFSEDLHEWYDKNPNKVTEDEFNQLL